jgi:hypothetical protein
MFSILAESGCGKRPAFWGRKRGMLTKTKWYRRQVSFLMLAMTGPNLTMNRLLSIGVCLFLFVSLFVPFASASTRTTASENEKVDGTVTSQQSLFS